MQDIKILIIANGEEAMQAYTRALSYITSAYDVAVSFKDAQSMATETPYNGILLDLLTLVRSSKEEKLIAYNLINLYPSIRIKYDMKSKEIKLAPIDQSLPIDSQASLRLFIESRCDSFPARSLSRHKRTNTYLDVLLCSNDSFSQEESIKTFTVDISVNGAFLHTTQSFQRGDRVWLRFKDLVDSTPIEAKVCWNNEWGVGSRSVSGIGIEFEILSDSQKDEILSFGENISGIRVLSPPHKPASSDYFIFPDRSIHCMPVDVPD